MLAEFGFSRWGADVVRLAEPLSARVPNPLAPRARSLARNQGVELTVTGSAVAGLVSSGAQASIARLEFVAMSHDTAGALRELLGSATEPDDDVHQRAKIASGGVGPQIAAADCSCRARGDRCVHILATLYALAAAIDHRPALALELQGFDQFLAARSEQQSEPGSMSVSRAGSEPQLQPIARWIPLAGLGIRDYWDPPATG